MDGARLECTPDGLFALAAQALARKAGARGLRAVMEELLLDTMFDLPSEPRRHFHNRRRVGGCRARSSATQARTAA